jgi:hypothetical protein
MRLFEVVFQQGGVIQLTVGIKEPVAVAVQPDDDRNMAQRVRSLYRGAKQRRKLHLSLGGRCSEGSQFRAFARRFDEAHKIGCQFLQSKGSTKRDPTSASDLMAIEKMEAIWREIAIRRTPDQRKRSGRELRQSINRGIRPKWRRDLSELGCIRKVPLKALDAGGLQQGLPERLLVIRADPDPGILMFEMPIRPTGQLSISLHARRAGLQRVIGAEPARQDPKSQFQMRNILGFHSLDRRIRFGWCCECPVVREESPLSCNAVGRSQPSQDSRFEAV